MAFAAKSGIVSDVTRWPRKRAPASSGRHSELHKLVIGEMPSRFCFDSEDLYSGGSRGLQLVRTSSGRL